MAIKAFVGALLLSSLAPTVLGQSPVWGQCGGLGWTGPKSCVSGSCCTYSNDWYSQCIPGNNCGGGGNPTTTQAVTTPGGQPTTTSAGTTPTGGSGGPNSQGCGKNPTLTSGTKTLTVNGKQRQYIIRVPNNYDRTRAYRLIFGIHWRGGTMNDVAGNNWYYGLRALASESAIFIAPNGLNNGWANSGGEDVAFIDAIIAQVEADLCVNQSLRFSTGFSWGGGMSYSLACSRATSFRAVSVIAGAEISGCAGGTQPIAYLGIHGIQDNVLAISNGRAIRDKFLRNNGCASKNAVEPSQGSLTHVKTEYSCRAGYPVWWIAFDGGHVSRPSDGTTGDNESRSFAPGETWAFFTQFS